MFKKIKSEYVYQFNIKNTGVYTIRIEASCQEGKYLGWFGGEDLRVEIDGIKLREIPAKGRSQYFNIPPAWNGTALKGLAKTVVFILNLDKGEHAIKFFPKDGAIITREPVVAPIRPGGSILKNMQAENGNRRPWITVALINLPLKILDVSATCEERESDSDDLKLIIDGRIEKNKESNWWGKNWFWQGRKLQGYTKDARFYAKLDKGIHYIELWADRMPVLNSVHMDLGIKIDLPPNDEDNSLTQVPSVDNPKWTGDFNDDTEQMILARAIWGEARGASKKLKIAVAWSIKNRVGALAKWDTYRSTILDEKQYSCFWEKAPYDPNLQALQDPLKNQNDYKKWQEVYEIAGQVINGNISDPTNGSNHYYDDSRDAPYWATNDKFVVKIGNILFYKL